MTLGVVAFNFRLTFQDRGEFERELEQNLRRGRTFLPGVETKADRAPCVLQVEHPETRVVVELRGEVVFVQTEGPGKGAGIALTDPELDGLLDTFEASVDDESPGLDSRPVVAPGPSVPSGPENVHLRIRRLAPAARERMARSGNLAERTALERAFGGSVWEALLQNAQITGAEVARIAKNGTAPAPILGLITGHAGWLSRPEVRRALLQNRRLPPPQVDAVLRATPQNELRLLASQAVYPPRVREAAKRLLRL